MKIVIPVKICSLIYIVLLFGVFICSPVGSNAQDFDTSNTAQQLTLKDCIDYALKHQPTIKQSEINVSVARLTNAINESTLYPQVNGSGTVTHYFQTPTAAASSTTPVEPGVQNTAVPGIQVSQAIFSPTLIYALRSAPLYVKAAEQATDSTKIGVVANVSKSFYNLLLTLQQIGILKEDTVRLAQNVRDTYHQYVGGIVDETDYEEATITLNNSLAQLKQADENIVPQYATLKQLMGFPPHKQFNISYDSSQMVSDIKLDTTEQLKYEKRIEFQQLATELKLQHSLSDYYRYSALPTVSAFFDYDYEFENNSGSGLFSNSYPYSYIGLSVSVPIFNGFYRINNLKRSRLEERSLGWGVVSLKSEIYTEYTTALANYKGNLYNLDIMAKNEALAKRVYFVVTLQYKEGIVAYLNVITAESNLITAEIGYLNALSQLLSSKIDVQKAMGDIPY